MCASRGFAVRLRRKLRFGENPKQRCLAYLRQANDASFHKGLFIVMLLPV